MKEEAKRSWIGPVLIAVFLCYVLSAGPVFMMMRYLTSNVVNSPVINTPMMILYLPHLYVAKHFEGYFDYLTWWAGLAKSSSTIESYEKFKRNFPF
jgi:hypothetical protein